MGIIETLTNQRRNPPDPTRARETDPGPQRVGKGIVTRGAAKSMAILEIRRRESLKP